MRDDLPVKRKIFLVLGLAIFGVGPVIALGCYRDNDPNLPPCSQDPNCPYGASRDGAAE